MSLKSQTLDAVSSQIRIEALPDPLENKLDADKAANIISKGILKGSSIDDIAQNLLNKLPKNMRTGPNLEDLKGFVAHTVISTMPNLDKGVAEKYAATDVSEKGVTLIADYEKFADKPYDDDAPGKTLADFDKKTGTATIGFGHAISTKEEFEKYKSGITREKALELYEKDLKITVDAVKKMVKVPLTQNQFDALVMLTFNIGPGGPKTGRGLFKSLVLKLVNEGCQDREAIERAFFNKAKSGGVRNDGLMRRRADEIELFFSGDYTRDYK